MSFGGLGNMMGGSTADQWKQVTHDLQQGPEQPTYSHGNRPGWQDDVNFEELFDLSSDPYELRNIIGSAPAGLLEEMRLRLAELRGCGKGPNATVLCP